MWVDSRNLFLNRLPAFTLDDGTFEIESPISFDWTGHSGGDDSDVEKYTKKDFEEEYQEEILVSRTNVLIRAGERGSDLQLSSLGNMYLDNQVLTAAIPALMVMLVFYFLIMFASKAVQYAVVALVYGLICRVGVRSPEGKDHFHRRFFLDRGVCQDTLCHLASVNSVSGYPVRSFWVSVISIVIVMSYMFKAEVSVLKPETS